VKLRYGPSVVIRAARRGVVLGLVVAAGVAAPAAAFTAPVLYIRETYANSTDHRPQSDWTPLTDGVNVNWLGGYDIGYAMQTASNPRAQEVVRLRIDSVPGTLNQPMNATPYCQGGVGQVGDIVALPYAVQFNGSGPYTITVGIGPPTGGSGDCLVPGPTTASTTATFTVGGLVAPTLVGSPMLFRLKPLPAKQFAGVQAPEPPGGDSDVRCARDATVNADGSVTGDLMVPKDVSGGPTEQIAEGDFGRPGAWTCVARGLGTTIGAQFDSGFTATPWSAPIRFDVRSDFERAQSRISSPRSAHPKIAITAEFPEAAAGGTLKLKLQKPIGCRKVAPHTYEFRSKNVGTFSATFNAKSAAVTLRKPRVNKNATVYYTGTVSFGGTRFYSRNVDPNPMLLKVTRTGVLSFVSPNAFPGCPASAFSNG
jgi:hypothetical protein